jgi:CDP-diacylglycerol--glycerol-3-phosphate 3-phosphatidyltransferase
MLRFTTRIWIVELTSLSRLIAGLLFASLVFQPVPRALLAGLYLFAISSDLLDGYLARRLKAVTYFGKVLDLVSDKSLTIISLLYAAARGIDMLPLALIASREVMAIGMRMIIIDGTPLLPSNRFLGGIMASMLWGNTLFLLLAGTKIGRMPIASVFYWICAIASVLTLVIRAYLNSHRIKVSLKCE